MRRITKRDENGVVKVSTHLNNGCYMDDVNAALGRLADFEDAMDDGRVIVLPDIPNECEMFLIYKGNVKALEFNGVYGYNAECGFLSGHLYKNGFNWSFGVDDIGKTVFMTRAEAVAALKARGEQ